MPNRLPCGTEACDRDFKTPASRNAHLRKIHGIYQRSARNIPKKTAAPTSPPLGANVKVMELALDPDENIVVVLSNGTSRWRAVIFEDVK